MKSKIKIFLFVKLPLAFIALTLLWVLALKWLPVMVTPLMVRRAIEYREDQNFRTKHKWVSIEKISPEMMKAVIASEDNLFVKHNGFDKKAVEQMLKDHKEKGKKIRGCSTISQQTAKNVFTWSTRSVTRKVFEAYFTFLIEKIWGKERIMEVYLNVVELGKGIYGVQSASNLYYDKPASKLTSSQAACLAACLPSPLTRTPQKISAKRRDAIISLTHKIEYPDWITRK